MAVTEILHLNVLTLGKIIRLHQLFGWADNLISSKLLHASFRSRLYFVSRCFKAARLEEASCLVMLDVGLKRRILASEWVGLVAAPNSATPVTKLPE